MLRAEERLSGFRGRQTDVEIAVKATYGRVVGMKGRADEACFHYLVVPSGRPTLQLELEIRRQQFRLVEHNDLQCRGGCIRRCVGSIVLHPQAGGFARTAKIRRWDDMSRTETALVVGVGNLDWSSRQRKSQQRHTTSIHGPTIDVLAKPRHERVFVVCIAANIKPVAEPEHLGSPKERRLSRTLCSST